VTGGGWVLMAHPDLAQSGPLELVAPIGLADAVLHRSVTGVQLGWHRPCGFALLRPNALCRCPVMANPVAVKASDYVLLHRDTGSALYTTRATEQEIHRANVSLSRAGQRSRFVAARHLMRHQSDPQS
jgi:hypothetical protein